MDQTTLFGEKIPSFTQRTSLRSLREIEDLTGFDFKRIKKRIGHLEPKKIEGSIHYYDAKEVLPSLYSEAENKEKPLQLDQERAKLAARQAEKTELVIQQIRGELIPAIAISEALSQTFGAIRSKLLALPSKTAMLLAGLTPNEIEFVLKDNICDLLEELSHCDIRTIPEPALFHDPKEPVDVEAPA